MRYLKTAIVIFAIIFSNAVLAQKTNDTSDGYVFKEDFRLPVTSVKNQYRSGTCWSFSGLSFFESEMLRKGKDSVNLSEMFVVNHCYKDKARLDVRMQGHINFGGGGAFHDDTYVLKKYGLVPEEIYTGLHYGTKKHVHGELDEVLKDFVDGVIKNKNKTITPAWGKAYDAIVDTYLGQLPEKFTYKGKEYTPRTFADDYCGLKPGDYVEISSFTHHPFYEKFILEVPDNWLSDKVYNLPLNEFEQVLDYSLKNGYTIAWGADVSTKGFMYNKGVAVIPETDIENLSGLEKAKWEKLTERERQKQIYSEKGPVQEKKITQKLRQEKFDSQETTDDHGMHIIGIAHDQNGTKYYIVKNSWGTNSKYKGYFYASAAFVMLQTTDIMVNKNGIPKNIRKKLGL